MDKVPIFVLTGFLGSGKSTLLNSVLEQPGFHDTAVVINEFGDVALDHDLVRVGETRISRTTTGCLCCTMGSDIVSTLHEFLTAADSGEIAFDRVIVETTGLADPAPIINQLLAGGTIHSDPINLSIAGNFELAGVVTLVDVVTGELSIENYFEASKQIAFADCVVLTKTDQVRDPASIRDLETLRTQITLLNPLAPVTDLHGIGFDAKDLFQPRRYVPSDHGDDVVGWLALEKATAQNGRGKQHVISHAGGGRRSRHGERVRTFAIIREQPVEEPAIRKFLELLAESAGPGMLRVKGIVRLKADPDRPRVVHAVQHVVHPLTVLDKWPAEDHRTRLVFITDGIDPGPVNALFQAAIDGRPVFGSAVLSRFGSGILDTLRAGVHRFRRVSMD